MHYRLRYSLDFDLKIRSGQGWILFITAASGLTENSLGIDGRNEKAQIYK